MVLALTSGQTAESTTVSGLIMICRELAFTSMLTECDTTDSIKTTKRKATVSTFGMMAESMKVGGIWANSTD
jgi:hypothetical protein